MVYKGRLDGAESFPNIFPSLTNVDKAMAGLGGAGTGALITELFTHLPPEAMFVAFAALASSIIYGIASQDKGAPSPKQTEWNTPEDTMRQD